MKNILNHARTLWGHRPVRLAVFAILALLAGTFEALDHLILLQHSVALWGERLVIPIETHRHVLWPQVREVLDGYRLVADTQLYEYRIGPPLTPWPWLPIALYAAFWHIFGAAEFLPWSTIIVAAVSFLILSEIITEITGRRFLGIVFSFLLFSARLVAIMLFPASAVELRQLVNLFIPGVFPEWVPRGDLFPYESYNPGFLIFGPALLLVLRAFKADRPRTLYAAGVVSGLLLYIYAYHWVYMTIVLGCVGLLQAIRRKWSWVRSAAVGIGLNLLVTAPFWWNQALLHREGILREINARNAGYELGHYFRTSQWRWYLVWLTLSIVLAVAAKRRKETGIAMFLGVLFLALVVSLNIQVVTGLNFQSDHWIQKVGFLPLALSLFLVYRYSSDWAASRGLRRRFTDILIGVLVLGAIVGGVGEKIVQAASREANPPFDRGLWQAYRWMDQQLPRDAVVMTPSVSASAYLTIYTGARSFLAHPLNSHALEAEVIDRFYATYALFGFPPEYLRVQLAADFDGARERFSPAIREIDFDVERQVFWAKFRSSEFDGSLTGYRSGGIPPEVQASVLSAFEAYDLDLSELVGRYRLDYVLSTPYDRAIGTVALDDLPFLERVYQNNTVVLYRVIPDLIPGVPADL